MKARPALLRPNGPLERVAIDLRYARRFLARRRLSSLLFPVALGSCAAIGGLLLSASRSLSADEVDYLTEPVQSLFITDPRSGTTSPPLALVKLLREQAASGIRFIGANSTKTEVKFGGSDFDCSVQSIHFDIFELVDPGFLSLPYGGDEGDHLPAVVSSTFEDRVRRATGVESALETVISIGELHLKVVNVAEAPLRFDAANETVDVWVPWALLARIKGFPEGLLGTGDAFGGSSVVVLGKPQLVRNEVWWLEQAARAEGLLSDQQGLVLTDGFRSSLESHRRDQQLVGAGLTATGLLSALAIGAYLKLRFVLVRRVQRTHSIREALGACRKHQLRQVLVLNAFAVAPAMAAAGTSLFAIDRGLVRPPTLPPNSLSPAGSTYLSTFLLLVGLAAAAVALDWLVLRKQLRSREPGLLDAAVGNVAALLFGVCVVASIHVLFATWRMEDFDYGFQDQSTAVLGVSTDDAIFEGTNIRRRQPLRLVKEGLIDASLGYEVALASRAPLDSLPLAEKAFYLPFRDSSRPVNISVLHADSSIFSILELEVVDGQIPSEWESEGAVVVNRSLAEAYFGGASPIGHSLLTEYFDMSIDGSRPKVKSRYREPSTIVAVVDDFTVRSRRLATEPLVLAPLTFQNDWQRVIARVPPGTSLDDVAAALDLDPRSGARITSLAWLSDLVSEDLAEERAKRSIAWFQGVVSVALFSLVIYVYCGEILQTTQREMGIHNALGSTPRRLFLRVMGHLGRSVSVGFVVALLACRWAAEIVPFLDQSVGSWQVTVVAVGVLVAVVAAFGVYCASVIGNAVQGDSAYAWISH